MSGICWAIRESTGDFCVLTAPHPGNHCDKSGVQFHEQPALDEDPPIVDAATTEP
jgi:hypothetical protein